MICCQKLNEIKSDFLWTLCTSIASGLPKWHRKWQNSLENKTLPTNKTDQYRFRDIGVLCDPDLPDHRSTPRINFYQRETTQKLFCTSTSEYIQHVLRIQFIIMTRQALLAIFAQSPNKGKAEADYADVFTNFLRFGVVYMEYFSDIHLQSILPMSARYSELHETEIFHLENIFSSCN